MRRLEGLMSGDLGEDDRLETAPETRDYPALISALNEALSVLASTADLEDALRHSFDAAVQGCKAQRGLLFLVQQEEPPKLRNIYALGKIPLEQARAAESGHTAPGISAQVIRKAL